jgi:hypothetical protein
MRKMTKINGMTHARLFFVYPDAEYGDVDWDVVEGKLKRALPYKKNASFHFLELDGDAEDDCMMVVVECTLLPTGNEAIEWHQQVADIIKGKK